MEALIAKVFPMAEGVPQTTGERRSATIALAKREAVRLVYDHDNELTRERIAVIEAAQHTFAFAVQVIRDNDLRTSDALLDSMQDTFDNMARIAKAVVA